LQACAAACVVRAVVFPMNLKPDVARISETFARGPGVFIRYQVIHD
jgi:hypothetical protein